MSSLVNEILAEAGQGSDLWLKIKIGKFSSSEAHRLIFKKGNLTDKAKKYIHEKVAEILTGEQKNFDSEATIWGHQNEPLADEAFTLKTGIETKECGFIMVNEFYGGSPDRLIGDEALTEIKCPFNSANHIKHCSLKDVEDFKSECPEYYYQIQSNLNVTGRAYAFFISYDPRVTQCPLYVLLVKRDEKDIQLINECLEVATNELKTILEKLK